MGDPLGCSPLGLGVHIGLGGSFSTASLLPSCQYSMPLCTYVLSGASALFLRSRLPSGKAALVVEDELDESEVEFLQKQKCLDKLPELSESFMRHSRQK